jgi:hypothetical protein
MSENPRPAAQPEADRPPFLYEIRVKGRLSNDRWTAWFEESTVSTTKGDTTLRGSVPDHAALYGLLGRLRDLAVPLVSVRVLDAEAQRKLRRQTRSIDIMIHALMATIYLLLTGSLIAVTVYAAGYIHTALALMLLFAAIGGMAQAFRLMNELPIWRWITYLAWLACAVSLLVLVGTSGLLPDALQVAAALFLAAAGLVYIVSYLRHRGDKIRSNLVETRSPERAPAVPDPATTDVVAVSGAPEPPPGAAPASPAADADARPEA